MAKRVQNVTKTKKWPNVAKRGQKQSNRDQNAVAKRGQIFLATHLIFNLNACVCMSHGSSTEYSKYLQAKQ